MTTAYHEGVPGHHLQVGAVRCLADRLSRYQRTAAFVSGHGEGWALYAERLMGELGYLENPDYYLGMLSRAGDALRARHRRHRHAPRAADPGRRALPPRRDVERTTSRWSSRSSARCRPREFMASEIIRYLGWPAQAISYKVGERYWLTAREAAKKREGAAFNMKAFHTKALMLGPMGLAQLEKELS